MVHDWSQSPLLYRCDVCGRNGWWHSDGFEWGAYGGIEVDEVLHTCSAECRAEMGDEEKAFLSVFEPADKDDPQRSWYRKHERLIFEKQPRKKREDAECKPTTSENDPMIACPKCGFQNRAEACGHGQCAKCRAVLIFDSHTTYWCSVGAKPVVLVNAPVNPATSTGG